MVQGTISRMVRQGMSEEMTFQPRCKWRKGAATVVMWRPSLLNRGYPGQRGKSPELGQAWYRRGRERSGWLECRC